MVQEAISNAIMIIAAVIAIAVVISAIFPSIFGAIDSLRSSTYTAGERSATSVTITTCSFSADHQNLTVWMKNSGTETIANPGNIRIYYGDDSGAMTNYDTSARQLYATDPQKTTWGPGETYMMEISDPALPHDPGVHRVKVVLPGGSAAEATVTI